MKQWKKVPGFKNVTSGTRVEGDLSVLPTRWWNHWWLVLFGWKTIVTFSVPHEVAEVGYYVGFTAKGGKSWQKNERLYDKSFSMKIGHETCVFWVLTSVLQASGNADIFNLNQTEAVYTMAPKLIARGPLH